MSDINPVENDFLGQVTAVIKENLSNEQFGVSELADKLNMSRSNLLRKVKKDADLSVSQLISQVRLQRGMELLRASQLNVSEVSHQVGFSSTSYFIKCFREYYGYPPGEVGKKDESELTVKPSGTLPDATNPPSKKKYVVSIAAMLFLILAIVGSFYYSTRSINPSSIEKSIAVLPFINDSNDSTNVYLINGLMESTLNNLQQIKELKVISRTSAERYRNTKKSIPEIAKELNVNYIVEGSGQKMGDRILLNIQLIEASTDRHLWGNQYRKEAKDIFELQQEIAKSIVQEIQTIITPDEKAKIEKIPTSDLIAYDLFLKGRDLLIIGNEPNCAKALTYFDEAIKRDPKFAYAYAKAAIACYYMDIFKAEKPHIKQLIAYADNALLYDPKLDESLIAKALSFMIQKKNQDAVPYLEKALEYNPNSVLPLVMLADFYCNFIPNTTKYLEYSLRAVQLEAESQDSITTSYNYLRLGNALIQNGFTDEALKYIDKSLDYNQTNPFSRYVKAFILYAKTNNLGNTRDLLIKEYQKDSTRLDILQDIGKVSYYMHDYKAASRYDNFFIQSRATAKLDIFKHENLRMAYVSDLMGDKKKSAELLNGFKEYVENDKSIYHHLSLAVYACYQRDYKKCLEEMKLFTKEKDYPYWIVLFLKDEPILDPVKDSPEFKKVMKEIDSKFWDAHEELREVLEDKGLL